MNRTFHLAVALAFMVTVPAVSIAGDKTLEQSSQEKGMKGDKGKSKGTSQKSQKEPNAGGPMGETETGGSGPSGPAPLPPGKAPGFEGAGKDKGKGPEMGGPR